MQRKFSKSIGRTSIEKETSGNAESITLNTSMSSAEAIRARQTVQQSVPVDPKKRASAVSSCELLVRFAQSLWCERIQVTSGSVLHGLGGDSGLALSRLVTLACPSDCERVALGHSTGVNGCSCLVLMPTPTANAWKGGTVKDHLKANRETTFVHWWTRRFGQTYPSIAVIEAVQGFPDSWTDLED